MANLQDKNNNRSETAEEMAGFVSGGESICPEEAVGGIDLGELSVRITYAGDTKNLPALEELKKVAIYMGHAGLMEYASQKIGQSPSRLDYLNTLKYAYLGGRGVSIDDLDTSVGKCYQMIFGDPKKKLNFEKRYIENGVEKRETVTYGQIPLLDREGVNSQIMDNMFRQDPAGYSKLEATLKAEQEHGPVEKMINVRNGSESGQRIEPATEREKLLAYNRQIMYALGLNNGSIVREANRRYLAQQNFMHDRMRRHYTFMRTWLDYEAKGRKMEEEIAQLNRTDKRSLTEILAASGYDWADRTLGDLLPENAIKYFEMEDRAAPEFNPVF